MKKLKRVLVTGGAGFIGSHVAQELLDLYYNVIVADDLSWGFSGESANILPMAKKALLIGITGQDGSYLPEILIQLFQRTKAYARVGCAARTAGLQG